MRLRQFAFVCLAALVLAGCASHSEPYGEVLRKGPPITGGDIPPEVAGHEQEWPLANHDYSNTRTAVGSKINSGNVKLLHVVWTVPLKGSAEWGGFTGNAVVSGGNVYFEDMQGNTYAVDLKSGQQLWTTEYGNELFGPANVGIGYGRVYTTSRIDRYSALDIKDGRTLWEWVTGASQGTGGFQPVVFGKKVYTATQVAIGGQGQVSFSNYQAGASGIAFALDPELGKEIWHWQVVQAGFWGHPEINGGGGLWYPPAIDTSTGTSYWGSGNPAPLGGIKGYPNGSSRPGANLYTESSIALSKDGKLLWYNQVTPHDLFNRDLQVSPILAKVDINGTEKQVVFNSGKGGVVYAFDAANGQMLWKTPIGLHINDTLTEMPTQPKDATVTIAPGAWGGVETPMAFADNTVYALTANTPSIFNATMWDAQNGQEALLRLNANTHLSSGTADLVAMDASTGKMLWDHKFDHVAFGGVTVVNDLVFTATLGGEIYALARSDGHEVWSWQGPGGTNSSPAVVGDTIIWAFGLGDGPEVLALSLSGDEATLPAPEPQKTPVMTPQG